MTENRAGDQAAISSVLDDMYAAWAANDPDRFVHHYAEDATAVLPGSLRGSRKVIRDSMAAAFAGPLKGSSTIDRQLSLRFVGDRGAVAVCESGILMQGETAVPEGRKVYATWTFEKREDRWVVAAYHNSPVQAPAL